MSKLSFDPQDVPILSIAGETAILSERLDPLWLRRRFASPPEWMPEITDEQQWAENAAPTAASVLLPLVLRENGLTLLMTRRAAHLAEHGGQICFPGGRAELSDSSPVETALRETEEEVGLHRRHIDVIGTLPDYFTRTGYLVTPVVSIVRPPFELKAEPSEVDEIFEVPLAFLMNGLNHQLREAEFPGGIGRRTFYVIAYDRFFIWGATAAMLRNLFHFLRA